MPSSACKKHARLRLLSRLGRGRCGAAVCAVPPRGPVRVCPGPSASPPPRCRPRSVGSLCFFNDTATTEIYPLSLHDALPIYFPEGGLDLPAYLSSIERDLIKRSLE